MNFLLLKYRKLCFLLGARSKGQGARSKRIALTPVFPESLCFLFTLLVIPLAPCSLPLAPEKLRKCKLPIVEFPYPTSFLS